MGRILHDVTEAELAVLQKLWEHGAASIRQLADALYPGGTNTHYATVQKLLERLEAKRCVRRDRSGPVNVFEATVRRDDLIERRLQDVAESLCEGSRAPLLMHLVDPKRLSRREIQALRELIDELDSKQPAPKKRKGKP